jgi:hypothetical protein
MEFLGFSQSYNRYGASSFFSPVADLLMVRLTNDYGSAVESIYFTALLSSGRDKPRRTLEDLFQRFHSHLDKLPKVTFRRKMKRIEVQFLSRRFVADDDESNKLSADKCNTAAEELASALPLITKRLSSTDNFDVKRFLMDATQMLTTNMPLNEWEQLCKEAQAMRQALYTSKSPWELLDIDWSQFHPKARQVLDDPFFWEQGDDLSPNGNDTGADLLEDFRRWNKHHKNQPPVTFLAELFTAWDIMPIDWRITDLETVRKLKKE